METSSAEKSCVYLSDTAGIHDLRWRTALQSMGWHVDLEVPDSTTPVFAGPLTSTSLTTLDRMKNPVIGLSWGWDLHAAKGRQSITWLSRLSGLVVDSVPTRNIAIELGMNPASIVMIPWGINLQQFSPTARNPDIDLSILSLRAHEQLYRIHTIVAAIALLQEQGIVCSLTIGNEGSLTQKLKDQVIDLGLNTVSFIGRVQENELPELFTSHGVYVSAAETDGTSVTLLQAMAMEIPVVVSNSPGNIAWLNDAPGPTGRIFELGDPADLALKLKEVIGSPEQSRGMTHRGREVVEGGANWSLNIWRLDELLTSVLI
jgi:glycosyltransferase involved in cell wall biosynthesis